MKLSKTALDLIREPQLRMKVAVALGITDQAVQKLIKRNSDNLTKAAAMEVIRKETGLTDRQILVKEVATA